MKPDWKDAPEWARYAAMDNGGDWCWYETEPVFNGRACRWDCGGRVREAGLDYPDPEDTLEKRPEAP